MKIKKYNTKNLDIKTRITLATISGILLAVFLIGIFIVILNHFLPDFYNFSDVDTNNYSILNNIQWNETTDFIVDELLSDSNEEDIKAKLDETADSIKQVNAYLYIEKDNKLYYTSDINTQIYDIAHSIVNFEDSQNINYFGDNGLVITNHIDNSDSNYTILITSKDYTVNNINLDEPKRIMSTIFSKNLLLVFIVFIILLLSIILVSVIAARSITKPMNMLVKGVNEISEGNLEYKIDYDSTNEIGTTVKAVNALSAQLYKSIQQRNDAENQRKQMVAGIAHDLRTPLTSVKGYLEGLRDGIANTPAKKEQYLQTIYSSTLDMERLLNELQTMSRLERGNIVLEQEPININDFLIDYVEEMTFVADKQNFILEYNQPAEKDRNAMVMLDAGRFSRVLMNIISNSIKYSSKAYQGKISISLSGYDKHIVIVVKDNGIGISKENLPHIFETFYRADQARTRVSEGSGIGLAVCKEIVERHNGHIWATSEEGVGTSIFISLNRLSEDEINAKQ